MKEFVKDNLDKLMLAAGIFYGVHIVIFVAMYVKDPVVLSWAQGLTDGFVGALLGLITGVRVGQKMEKDKQKEAQ